MKQSTEDRIVSYVTTHPNQSSADIAKGLKISTGTVKPQLKALSLSHRLTRTQVENPYGIGRQEFRYFVAKKAEEKPKAPEYPNLTIQPTHTILPTHKIIAPVPKDPPVKQPSDLDQIISDFASRIAESVVAEAASCVVAQPAVVKPEPKKLPSIFIGGLQPSATSPLAKEFDGVADLRFVTPEDHANVWKSKSAHADHVIIMVGFVGHKHVEAVQSTGIKPTLVHGGTTHLKDKIMELALK